MRNIDLQQSLSFFHPDDEARFGAYQDTALNELLYYSKVFSIYSEDRGDFLARVIIAIDT